MKDETRVARAGLESGDPKGAISAPIYQTATFRHPGAGQSTGFDYTRSDNPTRRLLENELAALENGADACAFSTGMAALTAIAFLFRSGDTILLSEDLYGGTWRLFEEVFGPLGLRTRYVDTADLAAVEAAVDPTVRGLLVETPSNPGMRISDLAALSALARRHGLVHIVDNTFLSPLRQKPLDLGADLVVHSGTKYLAGHNDTLCGFVVAKDKVLGDRIRFLQNSSGSTLGPLESWLVLRGMKTLAIRLDRQEDNALRLARWLQTHPAVWEVHYPGLDGHPGKEIQERQARGPGAMVSFRTRDGASALSVIDRVRVISYAESLGGVESLVTYPLTQTHAALPEALRLKTGVTDNLLRLSVGIEAFEDLRDDLDQALALANRV
jgi:cystathionine beta-lyase/cystathionine gamma-synthase